MFLFIRASAFEVPNVDKCCACLIHEEYCANLGDRNFPHAAVPVNYTSKFQQFFEATTYIKMWFLPPREQSFMSIMRTNAF
jgi:hypothetical protein